MERFDPAFGEIKETFESIDKDGSGSLEFDEFRRLMLKMDHTRSEGDLRAQFAAIDADRDGRASFAKFQAWLGIDGR